MPSIDEAKILIKESPISSIVGMFIPLSKKGGNYEGICPFHADTKPSLKVNDSKGLFKCFVCDTGGDAIKFAMLYNNQSYPDAIKDIASKIGVTVEEEKKGQVNPKLEMAIRVLNSSCKLYRKFAAEVKPSEYTQFLKKRNLNETSVNDFQIGFSPKNNALTNYLNSLPVEQKDKAVASALDIGLIKDGKWGHYDFFRERVMFPIWDHSGKIRGYSSRAVRDDQVPKYLNSGESFVFNKGSILYGFHLARNEIRNKDSVILVEGNMDVIALHQFGFKNSVGTMGVALSEKSLSQLLHLTHNVFLGMDSDPAGISAMEKINASFMEKGVLPKFVDYSPCKDPDEFLQEFGRLELVKKLESAKTFLDYQIGRVIPENAPTSSDAKMELLGKIFKILAPLGTNLIAKDQAVYAATRLGFNSTKEDIVNAYQQSLKTAKQPEVTRVIAKTSMQPDALKKSHAPLVKEKTYTKVTKRILSTLVTYPEALNTPQNAEILDLMGHSEVKQFIQWLKGLYLEIDDSEYVNLVGASLSSEDYSQELCDVVTNALFEFSTERLDPKVTNKMVSDLVYILKEEQLKQKRLELKLKQKETLNQEESFAILKEIQEVQQQLSILKNTKA